MGRNGTENSEYELLYKPVMSQARVKCSQCGHSLGEAASCPICGYYVDAGDSPCKPESDVYLLLVMANMLRLRGQWVEAEAKCSEALRRDRDNASACSVMGDIARDRGNLRDAIEWYRMALGRNPASAPDRKKLDAVLDQVSLGQEGRLLNKAGKALRRGIELATGDLRPARAPAPVTLMVAAALAAILLGTALVILLGKRTAIEPPEPPVPAATGAFIAAPPEAEEPETGESATAVGAGTVELSPGLAELQRGLTEHLRQVAMMTDPNCHLISVEIDPLGSVTLIRVSMPRLWVVGHTRENMLAAAGALAAGVTSWEVPTSRVRVRCDMRGSQGPEEMAMVAEGESAELAEAGAGSGSAVAEAFDYVWWHPELREAGETEPPL